MKKNYYLEIVAKILAIFGVIASVGLHIYFIDRAFNDGIERNRTFISEIKNQKSMEKDLLWLKGKEKEYFYNINDFYKSNEIFMNYLKASRAEEAVQDKIITKDLKKYDDIDHKIVKIFNGLSYKFYRDITLYLGFGAIMSCFFFLLSISRSRKMKKEASENEI